MVNRSSIVALCALAACGEGVGNLELEGAETAEGAASASVVYSNGYETGTLATLLDHTVGPGASVSVVTSPVARGSYAGKYDLRFTADPATGNSSGSYRAENQFADNKGDFEFGAEYWVSMKYRFADWANDTSAECAPMQVHRRPSSWAPGCGGQVSAYSNAPFLMFAQNGVSKIITFGGVVSWSGPLVRDQWQNVVFHFKITTDTTGYVEAWKDGVKLFRRDGKLHEKYDDCGGLFRSPYFNVGVYKWDWRAGRKPTQSTRRTLYIDDLQISKGPGGLAPTPDAGTPSPSGLVASYRFDETAGSTTADASGSGNLAALMGGATRVARAGGQALKLDGANDYVQAAASSSLDITGNKLTIAARINFENTGDDQIFLGKPASATAHASPYFSYSLHGLYVNATALRPRFFLTIDGQRRFIASSVSISPGWHHVAGVYDGAAMRIFVDGVARGTLAVSGNITSFPTPLRLGTNGGQSEHFKGALDDVQVFTRALSTAEVSSLAQ